MLSVRKLKLGPSNRAMIPSIPQIPPMLCCRLSPGRFYSSHHRNLTWTPRKLLGYEEGSWSRQTQEHYWTGGHCSWGISSETLPEAGVWLRIFELMRTLSTSGPHLIRNMSSILSSYSSSSLPLFFFPAVDPVCFLVVLPLSNFVTLCCALSMKAWKMKLHEINL